MENHGQTGSDRVAEPAEDTPDDAKRETLKAVAKYAAFLAGTTSVVMTPEQALAQAACSKFIGKPNPPPYC